MTACISTLLTINMLHLIVKSRLEWEMVETTTVMSDDTILWIIHDHFEYNKYNSIMY